MRVILVRHGQTDWNMEHVFRGRIDVPLNALGLRQAQAIADTLMEVPVDACFSSPLMRAAVTARKISRYHEADVICMDEWTDMNFGSWEGLSIDAVQERFPDEYALWISRPEKALIPGGETLEAVRQRALTGLKAVLAGSERSAEKESDGDGYTAVVVSHGLVNKILLCEILGLGLSRFWKVKQDNGAINVFEYTRSGAKLFLLNDLCHIHAIAQVIRNMGDRKTPLG